MALRDTLLRVSPRLPPKDAERGGSRRGDAWSAKGPSRLEPSRPPQTLPTLTVPARLSVENCEAEKVEARPVGECSGGVEATEPRAAAAMWKLLPLRTGVCMAAPGDRPQ